MALEAGNVGIDQWPENPVRLAAWLADANWSVVRVLKHCDQGFRNPRVKFPKSLLGNCTEKYISPDRLKHLALIFILNTVENPMGTINIIKPTVKEGSANVVSQYVLDELTRHYVMPEIADCMTHCLRPDILQLVQKMWKHAPFLGPLEQELSQALKVQWNCNPYALSTRLILSTLAWVGAAVVETGQRKKANFVVGNTFFNICRKDRAITLLIIVCAFQFCQPVREVVRKGPSFLSTLCARAPPVFC